MSCHVGLVLRQLAKKLPLECSNQDKSIQVVRLEEIRNTSQLPYGLHFSTSIAPCWSNLLEVRDLGIIIPFDLQLCM